jgi:hypothetical protein
MGDQGTPNIDDHTEEFACCVTHPYPLNSARSSLCQHAASNIISAVLHAATTTPHTHRHQLTCSPACMLTCCCLPAVVWVPQTRVAYESKRAAELLSLLPSDLELETMVSAATKAQVRCNGFGCFTAL